MKYVKREVSKSLKAFAKKEGLSIKKIKFTFQGLMTIDGFALINKAGREVITIEGSTGRFKWFVSYSKGENRNNFHAHTISEVISKLNKILNG